MALISPAQHFGAKASHYKYRATTQQAIAQKLSSLITNEIHTPEGLWLDIGSGPGILGELFFNNHSNITPVFFDISEESLIEIQRSNIKGYSVCGNMDNLPFKRSTFGGITASSSLQWSSNINILVENISKLIIPNGTVALALFTEGTLEILRKTQKHFNLNSPVTFPKKEEISELLENSGFTIKSTQSIIYEEFYSSGYEALRAISEIGASFHSGKRLSPGELKQFISYLESHSTDKNRHCNSYTVSFFIATAKRS